jgi:hypothetical protein
MSVRQDAHQLDQAAGATRRLPLMRIEGVACPHTHALIWIPSSGASSRHFGSSAVWRAPCQFCAR